MLAFGSPGLRIPKAMGCTVPGQPAPCQNPPTVRASAWMSPARDRQSLDWLSPGSSPESAGSLSQGHYKGKHLVCISAQCSAGVHPGARQPPGALDELQPGWRCASALQTAGQSCCSEPCSERTPRQPEVHGHHNCHHSWTCLSCCGVTLVPHNNSTGWSRYLEAP